MASAILLEVFPAIRECLRMELERMGHEVIGSVGDGQVGLQQIRQDRPDLVILDLSTPGKSGMDLIERIRAHSPGSRLLVYTALNAEHFAPLCLKAGVNGFVSKSEDLDVLRSSIRSVLTGRNHYPVVAGAPPDGDELSVLSPREHSVLQLIGEGKTNQAIAEILSISFKTVSTHKSHLQEKLRLSSRLELVEFARRHGLGQSSVDYGYVVADVPEQWSTHIGRLQAMLDAAGHPMYLRDREGRLLLCNRSFLEFYQVAADEVAGRDLREALWFEVGHRERIVAKYRELLAGERPYNLERAVKVRGVDRLLNIWGMPYRNERGQTIGMVGGVRDLTQQAHLLSKLREERRRTREADEAKAELFELILVELNDALTAAGSRVASDSLQELFQLMERLTRLASAGRGRRTPAEEPCNVYELTLGELADHGVQVQRDESAKTSGWIDPDIFRELLRTLLQIVGPHATATVICSRNSRGLLAYELTLSERGRSRKASAVLLRIAELQAEQLGAGLTKQLGADEVSLTLAMELEASVASI